MSLEQLIGTIFDSHSDEIKSYIVNEILDDIAEMVMDIYDDHDCTLTEKILKREIIKKIGVNYVRK